MQLSQKIARISHRVLSILVDDIRLLHYGFIFFGVILFLGWLYYALTPYANGIGSGGEAVANLSFPDALYFSVVTVSSLGYGDMHPMGFSKFVAAGEVLFGLTIMGIMLAKLTSSRLSHHVSRLYTSELQKRLEEFSSDFDKVETSLRSCMRDLGHAFQQTPTGVSQADPSAIVQQCSLLLSRFRLRAADLNEYIVEETYKGAFFGVAPRTTLQKTAEAIDQCLFVLAQLVTSLSPEAKTIVLNRQNRRHASAIIETVRTLAQFVVGKCKNAEVCEAFSQLIQNSSTVPESYYTVPELEVESQPDQIFAHENEPKSDNNFS